MTRFIGYGWNVTRVADANDLQNAGPRLRNFPENERQADADCSRQPHRLRLTEQAGLLRPHGEPLGEAEVRLAKKFYGWPEDAKFLVPDGVYDQFKNGVGKRGAETHAAWKTKFAEYQKQFPQLADQLNRIQTGKLPMAGTKTCLSSRPTPRVWRLAIPPARR